MKLARVYESGEDMGVRFEPGDEFWVRTHYTNRTPEVVFCEVIKDGIGISLRPKVIADE